MLRKFLKESMATLITVTFIITVFMAAKSPVSVNASANNIVKKNITIIAGQTYRLERPDRKKIKLVNEYVLEPKGNLSKLTNKNKKVAVLKRKKGSSYSTIKGKKVYDKYVDIKALKAGKTTFKFDLKLQDGKKYSYKIFVKVKKLNNVQKRSEKALKKYEADL